MNAAPRRDARAAPPFALANHPPPMRRFTSAEAKSHIRNLNRSGAPGHIGAFFEDQFAAVTAAVRPKYQIGPEGGTVPDLEFPGFDTLVEVKSGSTADHMRFSVPQLEDYRHHIDGRELDALYLFVWYRGRDAAGKRTTLASLEGERGRHAIARLHRHLTDAASHALLLDVTLVDGIVRRLRDEVRPARYPGTTIEKVGEILRTVVEAAFKGDRRARGILADFGPGHAGWRRLEGRLPIGGYGEMFAASSSTRAIPVIGVLRAPHADRLIRHRGPLSKVFPEAQLPRHPYRPRRPVGVITPF